jgi:hypothetical protein
MEYIETTIGRIAKYSEFLEKWTRRILPDTMETDEYCKTFSRYRKTFELVAKHFYPNTTKRNYLEDILNELYTSLRKINYVLTDYEKASIYARERMIREIKKCMERNEFIIQEYLSEIRAFDNKNKNNVPKNIILPKVTRSEINFLLSIKNQKYTPLSCENIFVNMVQYKDLVYYIETNDVFSFFYFYRTDDGWFWSPPKKTDPEDIWIECPNIRIDEGYWTGKIIPPYMAEYIIWLDLFFPNIPDFYMETENKKKNSKKKSKDNKKNRKDTHHDSIKIPENNENENEQKENNKECKIF